jgi:predicted transcriptional regulator
MLVVETVARIRREHFIKGKTIKEIARDLKVSRNTVRRVLRSGATSFEYEREVQPRPKLGRWTAELDELLASNAAKAAREQLTLIRIFEDCAGGVMTAATMPCVATPGDGPRSADKRRPRPTSR